jgi:sulfur-oxidizing protein SoxB
MIARRHFLQAGAAVAALGLPRPTLGRALAEGGLTEAALLDAPAFGNVTIAHVTDIHGQLRPVRYREPEINLGTGEARGQPPHLTGTALLARFGIAPGSPLAHALTHLDFETLTRMYGRMGGLDRIATVLRRLRAERPGGVLLLDGGDSWQGSYTANVTRGADMIEAMNLLGPDAMTGHWEFTYGTERVKEVIEALPYPFLGANIFDDEWNEPAFEATRIFERGGARIGVIGQAFPFTPIANPRWMMPAWSFGIREEEVAKHVAALRAEGVDAVVLLSHNGFDVDRKMAARVPGIDVILTGHTHDALPEPVLVGTTLLVASGSHGKFVSVLDLETGGGRVTGWRYRLIPVFADAIAPDPDMAALIARVRAPHEAELARVLGRTEATLYRRGNFNGTFDDLICDALLAERDAEIALSPGFRWGTTVAAGEPITVEDLHNACAMTYPAAYRTEMTGQTIRDILEDVADNLFNPDPYYQQGGDMVRVGGMAYSIDIGKPIGARIGDLVLLRTGEAIEAGKSYVVAGWASVNEDTEGPAIWDVVAAHLAKHPVVRPAAAQVRVRGA